MAQNWWSSWIWIGLISSLVTGAVNSSLENTALAQIKPDSTLGAERSSVTRNVLIKGLSSDRIDGGARRGANLFHSFQNFNVDEGRGAYFTNPTGIKNILSRVTGTNASNILGTLGVSGGNANLFLINPNGIIFGPNARLDVNGSFVGTTTNGIGLANGDSFSANPGDPLPTGLLNVNPNAFLFNQLAAQPITINSRRVVGVDPIFSSISLYEGLKVPDGQSLLLVGGDVNLDGGILKAPGGRVELGGLAEVGTVGLNIDDSNLSLSFPNSVERADISLTNEAEVDVTAGGGGSIAVNARNIDILGGSILSAGVGEGLGTVGAQAGDITLNATEAITIGQSDSIFSSSIENDVGTDATGNGGDINIKAGSLRLFDSAVLDTSTSGAGDAGAISVQVGGDVSSTGRISSSTSGAGDAGAISVQAGGDIFLTDSSISSDSGLYGEGNAGNILVQADGNIFANSSISSGTDGDGSAGNITVQADGDISFEDDFIFSDTSSFGTGSAGIVSVQAGGDIKFRNHGIQSSTFAREGNAGNLLVKADGNISFTDVYINSVTVGPGNAGSITVQAGSNASFAGGRINSFTEGAGNAGSISVKAGGDISFTEYGYINSFTRREGNAGSIEVQAEGNIDFENHSISNRTLRGLGDEGDAGSIWMRAGGNVKFVGSDIDSSTEGEGDGGVIYVQARSLSLLTGGSSYFSNGSRIVATTSGSGDAGSIKVEAADSVIISGASQRFGDSSGLFTSSEEGAGAQGGDITVQTDTLRILDRAVLSARTNSDFDGGSIAVNVNTLEVLGGGQILTTAFSSGNAGSIIVNATDSITLSGSDPAYEDRSDEPFDQGAFFPVSPFSGLLSNTNPGSTGNSGTIEVETGRLVVQDEAQVSASTAGLGLGGTLEVFAPTGSVEITGSGSRLTTETLGVKKAGNLTITTGQLQVLNGGQVSASTSGIGQGGALSVYASDTTLSGGGSLSARATGAGNAGSLTVNTKQLAVGGGAEISTATTSGQGGDIKLESLKSLKVSNGGQVSASTETGRAGSLNVNANENAAESVQLSGQDSGLRAQATAGGDAGSLTINTRQLLVEDGAEVTVSSPLGQAGNLTATANSILLNQGKLTAVTGAGDGGNIRLGVPDSLLNLLLMRNRSEISAEALGTANGGNIEINTDVLAALENSDISADAEQAFGGRVIIGAQGIFGTEFREAETLESDITATSELGPQFSGTVELNTPDVDPSSGLAPVPVVPVETEIVQACTPGSTGGESEFVVTGRGGLPPNPSAVLSSDAIEVDWVTLTSREGDSSSPAISASPTAPKSASMAEAQGWVVNRDGEVVLTASANSAQPRSAGSPAAECRSSKPTS
jgi:filamentous hemagglutinin family protein